MSSAEVGQPEILRKLLSLGKIVVAPGVFDGFSVHLVEKMGFNAALISGAGMSESRLGKPDIGLMGLEENLQGTRALVSSTKMALLADGDTGYGNPINVYYTVKAFEKTGVAGVMIEDQVWPKRCGHMKGKQVIPAREMVKKVEAAIDAKENKNFFIKARTDAAAILGIEEAIYRANLYTDAGADLIFADAILSKEDITRFAKEVKGKICVNMGFGIRRRSTTPLVSHKDLERIGVAIVEYPRLLTSAGLRGMMNALDVFKQSLVEEKVIERPDLMVSFEELNDLIGLNAIRDMEEKYTAVEEPIKK
jgi:2-methylisocitrate lyase-like PEP mutase family enzyme